MPRKGGIAFLSQSGAVGTGILDIAIKENLGFSGFVSLGNSAELDFSDFIEYYGNDENTKVIIMYIESLKEAKGKRFIEICKQVSKVKPIIAIKSGKSPRGFEAAKSHTAALASEQGVYEGIFKQAGIVEVNSIRQMINLAKLSVTTGKIGKRACIITNAGGLGVLTTDYCEKGGVDIVKLDEKIIASLDKILPPGWSRNNPIDILGEALAERYAQVMDLLEEETFFDFFIVLLTPQYMTQPEETANVILNRKKPVVACFLGGESLKNVKDILQNQVILFEDPQDIGEALENNLIEIIEKPKKSFLPRFLRKNERKI
jgi:acetyltransferase